MLTELAVIFVCLAAGGLLKGATGAGTPILAIPALAAFFDVSFAIAIMLIPNLATNLWQIVEYWPHRPPARFLVPFVGGGVIGVAAGTWLLATLAPDALLAALGAIVLVYITLRLVHPDLALSAGAARALALPAGIAAGLLQGATGVSAPVSITFLNAMRLARQTFIVTISLLFVTFIAVQIPALAYAGIFTWQRALYSALAVLPVLAAMPLGSLLMKRVPAAVFDRAILVLLAALAVKLIVDAVV